MADGNRNPFVNVSWSSAITCIYLALPFPLTALDQTRDYQERTELCGGPLYTCSRDKDNLQARNFSPNINISKNPFPQNEPSVKISRKNSSRLVAAWRDFRTGITPAIRRVGYSYSTDGGSTWAPGALLPPYDAMHPRASDPSVAVDLDGNFYIGTISLDEQNLDGKVFIYKSTNEGVSFDTATVASPLQGGGEDRDFLACDLCVSSPYSNALYVAWTRIHPSGGIILSKSNNGGLLWSNPVQVSEDTSLGVGGAALATGTRGELYAVWVGAHGVFFDKSTDGGQSFGKDVLVSDTVKSGTGWPSIAVDLTSGTSSGTLYVVWEDERNGDSDIFLVRSNNGGDSWSSPARVNGDVVKNGTKQFLPSIAVDDSGRISIIFYSNADNLDSTYVRAYLTQSNDGGRTFSDQPVGTESFRPYAPNSAIRYGDYIGIDSWAGILVPVWMDQRAGGVDQEIYTAAVSHGTEEPDTSEVPVVFTLPQNYPNPFSGKTVVEIHLPAPGFVTLKVFDILGREVTTLIKEELSRGIHRRIWNAEDLRAGIYFYRLEANGFATTNKAAIVR